MHRPHFATTVTTLATTVLMSAAVPSAYAAENELHVILGRSEVVQMPEAITRVAISDPSIADVVVLPDREVLINGKAGGVTSLMVWTRSGRRTYEVSVGQDLQGLLPALTQITGSHDLSVTMANGTVILQGTVRTARLKALAERVAGTYATRIISELAIQAGEQIQVSIRVLEITKTANKELGVTWGTRHVTDVKNGVEQFLFQPLQGALQEGGPLAALTGLGGLFRDPLSVKIDLLVRENKARLLARPTLVANSGSTAKFLAGGEIPIPVQQALGMTTILWKEYGIRLETEPTLLDDGRIQLKLKPEVSSLDFNNGITINNFRVPALRTRKAETEVRLAPMESLALGGLIASEEAHNVTKLPGLGDIPILGELFKSHQFLNGDSELMIIVTPQLVQATRAEPPALQQHSDEFRQMLPKVAPGGGPAAPTLPAP
ncbi:MAG: type II and III secretion system protein family protein [Candidatus Sericytochromatia bacterium]|nr:type II and III secretion system protein family protein [Candidatus Sericytochromatia bacterium]